MTQPLSHRNLAPSGVMGPHQPEVFAWGGGIGEAPGSMSSRGLELTRP